MLFEMKAVQHMKKYPGPRWVFQKTLRLNAADAVDDKDYQVPFHFTGIPILEVNRKANLVDVWPLVR